MHLIETQDLSHTYKGNIDALKNISFLAPRNTRIAIIGPNGAGKSTLFKHFNGVLKPTSGKVLIRGEPITKENIREVRRTVGLVFQNPDDQLFSTTVFDDVAFGPLHMGLPEATVRARVQSALAAVGMQEYVDRISHHLSIGEKKRIAIATVLSMEPEILVLDEPTAGLDPQRSDVIHKLIRNLQDEFHVTGIVVTHDMKLAKDAGDRLLMLWDGRFIADGLPGQVMHSSEEHVRRFVEGVAEPEDLQAL